jgi:hypothetical protein
MKYLFKDIAAMPPEDRARVLLELTGPASNRAIDPGDIQSAEYVAPPCKITGGPHIWIDEDGGIFCEACDWHVTINEPKGHAVFGRLTRPKP